MHAHNTFHLQKHACALGLLKKACCCRSLCPPHPAARRSLSREELTGCGQTAWSKEAFVVSKNDFDDFKRDCSVEEEEWKNGDGGIDARRQTRRRAQHKRRTDHNTTG